MAVPRAQRNTAFERESLSLHRLEADTLGPLIFVNPDLTAVPLAEALGGWLDRLRAEGIELAGTLELHSVTDYVVDANWKLVCENGFECYHCPTNHPELAAIRDVRPDFWFDFHDTFTVHGLPNEPMDADARGFGQRAVLSFLWPNLFPVVRDGGFVAALQVLPLDVERSVFRREYWFSADVDDAEKDELVEINTVTDLEDVALLAGVQRGLRSRYHDRGRLLLPNTEPGVHYYQRLIHRALMRAGD